MSILFFKQEKNYVEEDSSSEKCFADTVNVQSGEVTTDRGDVWEFILIQINYEKEKRYVL